MRTLLASLVFLTVCIVALTGAARVASAGTGVAIQSDGKWQTTGPDDVNDLFPTGTPGPGVVMIDNQGEGDVVVQVFDAEGNQVGKDAKVIPEIDPTFGVPAGGRVKLKGKTKVNAKGTYKASFAVDPAKMGSK